MDSGRRAGVPQVERELRVALFGSFYRGYCVLDELLLGPLREKVVVVGVATDDPSQSFVSPYKRVWQYAHQSWEETMVADRAVRSGLPVYRDRVKSERFYRIFEEEWRPELCIMATFGQRIDSRLYGYPRAGFYNLHPSDDGVWPSRYAGGNPFRMMLDDRAGYCVIRMHRVDDGWDTGHLVATSERIAVPPDCTVVDLHKMSSPVAALLVRGEISRLLDRDGRAGG
jgi:methionyl-tRNA formyltransferase